MKCVDIVYHFAAMTDLDTVNSNPATAIEINIAGTSNILDSCIEEKIQRLIFSSSVYVYSKTGGIYKSTKQACELLIKDYDKMYGLNYTILQPLCGSTCVASLRTSVAHRHSVRRRRERRRHTRTS